MDFNKILDKPGDDDHDMFGQASAEQEEEEENDFFGNLGGGQNGDDQDEIGNICAPFQKFAFSKSKREPSYIDTGDYEAQTVNEVVKNEEKNHLNEYTLLGKVGSGSFGKVIQVLRSYYEDDGVTLSQSRYALKVIKKSKKIKTIVDEQGQTQLKTEQELLQKELDILKKLNHPNLCKLYQIIDSELDENVYLVMEFCDKGQLLSLVEAKRNEQKIEQDGINNNNNNNEKEQIQGNSVQEQQDHYEPSELLDCYLSETYGISQKQMNNREALAKIIFMQVAQGIEYLHTKRIVNRDIKIDNILAKSIDCEPGQHIKLIDFSTAVQLKSSKQRLFYSAGTPAYMSPENCVVPADGIDGFAADIWSFGVSLFVFVNLRLPFEELKNENEQDVFKKIIQQPLPVVEQNSKELTRLLGRLCAKNQSERPTIKEVLADQWFK